MISFDRRYFLAAVLCGLTAALALYYYLHQLESTVTAGSRYTEIVVAARSLPLRSLLQKEDLKIVRVERSVKEDGDLTCVEEAVGQVTGVQLAAGQRVKKEHLLPENNLNGFAHKIPPLWRAVTISADEVNGLSGMLMPGDRVDLIIFQQEEEKSELISDRQVLAIGQQTGLTKGPQQTKAQTITLLVKREEAGKIAFAEEAGTIRVALRPLSGEQTTPQTYSPKPKPKAYMPIMRSVPAVEPPRQLPKPILIVNGVRIQEFWP